MPPSSSTAAAHAVLQHSDVEQVDFEEDRSVGHPGVEAALDRGLSGGDVDVDEGDLAALTGELLDERTADAGSTTGDEHAAVDEGGVGGVPGHRCSLVAGPAGTS